MLKKINYILSRKTKLKFLWILVLMFPAAILEALGMGIFIPLIAMITDPSVILSNTILHQMYQIGRFQSENVFIISSLIFVCVFFIIKNVYLYVIYDYQQKVIFQEQVKSSEKLFAIYMNEPYHLSIQTNSSILIKNTTSEVKKVFSQLIKSILLLITDILIIISLLFVMFVVAPGPTLMMAVILGLYVILFFRIFRKKIETTALLMQSSHGQLIKWVQQGIGGMKQVTLTGRQDYFIEEFQKYAEQFAQTGRFNALILRIPRILIETLLIIIFTITLMFIFISSTDITSLFTVISLFVLATIRILPSISRLMNAHTSIKKGLPSLDVVYDVFKHAEEQRIPYESQLSNESQLLNTRPYFTTSIEVKQASFRYVNSDKLAVNQVSLSIPIGKSVAIIGPSGSGKTTLMDMILGLLEPIEGSVQVDGKDLKSIHHVWKHKVGYIPQFIYFTDDTIRRNIAFGIHDSQIDDEAIWRALDQSQIKEFVESLPGQLDASMGEAGNRMSGGQRQRIGIARALYHDPEILFLDEATSSLDQATEIEVMKALNGLHGQKTLIIITHRLSSIAHCDIKFEMKKGKLTEINDIHVN